MSRTIKFRKAGGPEVLEFIETNVKAPGPHEVRIKVRAIGLNRAESIWRVTSTSSPEVPGGPGVRIAGIVDAVGKDVTGVAVGDVVSTMPAFSQNDYFTYGEVILVPDYAVVKHPESLSFAEAASIWMMFVTAYGDAHRRRQGDQGRFRHHSCSFSSVGTGGDQLANYAGATPDGVHAYLAEREAATRSWRRSRHRDRRAGSGRRSEAHR